MSRHDSLLPNMLIVARREYAARVRSRLFALSTLLLAALAMLVAFSPLLVRLADRGTTTQIGIYTTDDALADRSIAILSGVLNGGALGDARPAGSAPAYRFVRAGEPDRAAADVANGQWDAALVAEREASGRIAFTFLTGEGLGADRSQLIGVGTLAVAILDWTASQPITGAAPFQIPTLDVIASAGPSAGGAPISGAEFAGRRVLGITFVVLIFIILVIYGMWVAAGVVAEKASRVMELMISAASARQLVLGKVLGIGAAGLTQYAFVLAPALLTLLIEDRIAVVLLGPGGSVAPSLAALSPQLLLAYAAFFVLGFTLYALIYAAAGSLVSRAEDLQVMALPLSLVAIGGYLLAIMALSGGGGSLVRVASFVPFWSPFVMLTRLAVGHVEPWEIALAYGLLVAAIPIVGVIAVRVYSAGVLLYGQRPGARQIVAAIVRPPA
jgi:ABC-2 type transport system permease protein